jgi:predicted RNA-binding Zn-ribbon protein involved in translation (DUF1610 family)
MSNSTFYVQSCPTCGRRLQIRVEYLGRRVVCQHCQGQFIAADPANRFDCPECGNELLRRADELLESVARRRPPARTSHPR